MKFGLSFSLEWWEVNKWFPGNTFTLISPMFKTSTSLEVTFRSLRRFRLFELVKKNDDTIQPTCSHRGEKPRRKETLKRRITVASSLNEVSTEQLGNRLMVRGGGGVLLSLPTPLYAAGFYCRYTFKDDANGFPSVSDTCYMRKLT